ncbi:MAG: hypothetical protein DDT19_00543 [Syntrophomonadaceae bacterium]|nr:hypothetical protein [Bacillota bacterium]
MGNKYWDNCITLTSGCTKVPVEGSMKNSACLHCWAETNHNRFMRKANKKYDHDFSEVRVHPENIGKLLVKPRNGKGKVYTVWNDAFHPKVSFKVIDRLLCTALGEKNKLVICTKRPDRMAEYFRQYAPIRQAIPNVFLGATVENDKVLWRVEELLKCRPFNLFLSIEPMLSYIHLSSTWMDKMKNCETGYIGRIIAGCESGKGARDTHIAWLEALSADCKAFKTPLFVKQLKINGKMQYNSPLSTIKKEDLWRIEN